MANAVSELLPCDEGRWIVLGFKLLAEADHLHFLRSLSFFVVSQLSSQKFQAIDRNKALGPESHSFTNAERELGRVPAQHKVLPRSNILSSARRDPTSSAFSSIMST